MHSTPELCSDKSSINTNHLQKKHHKPKTIGDEYEIELTRHWFRGQGSNLRMRESKSRALPTWLPRNKYWLQVLESNQPTRAYEARKTPCLPPAINKILFYLYKRDFNKMLKPRCQHGAGNRNRTNNLRFTKPLLCLLSYASTNLNNKFSITQ